MHVNPQRTCDDFTHIYWTTFPAAPLSTRARQWSRDLRFAEVGEKFDKSEERERETADRGKEPYDIFLYILI